MKAGLLLAHVYALQLAARRRARLAEQSEQTAGGDVSEARPPAADTAPTREGGTRCECST
jgi:hypothetical protein